MWLVQHSARHVKILLGLEGSIYERSISLAFRVLFWKCVLHTFSAYSVTSVLLDSLPPRGTCQVPLSMGFPRQEYWSGLPCPPPGDLLNPGTEPGSPALQADSLPTEPPGNPKSIFQPLYSSLFPESLCDDLMRKNQVRVGQEYGIGRNHLIIFFSPFANLMMNFHSLSTEIKY